VSNTDLILKKVENIIERLSSPLSEEELSNGWIEDSRLAMLKFFETLRDDLKNDVDVSAKAEYRSIARGMDHWGISVGQLLDDATEISMEIRKL